MLDAQSAQPQAQGFRVPSSDDCRRNANPLKQLETVPVKGIKAFDGFPLLGKDKTAVRQNPVHIEKSNTNALCPEQQFRWEIERWVDHQITFARIRSLLLSAPQSCPLASSTSTLVMQRCSISSTASTAKASTAMVQGLGCITSAAVLVRRSIPCSTKRRKSPSVKIPSTHARASTTAVAPSPLVLISRISSPKLACGPTWGTRSPLRMTSPTRVSSLRPSAPPGWERAKSS